MQRIRFQPVSNLILIPIKVMGIDRNSFRDIEVALDTGASTTSIPITLPPLPLARFPNLA